VPDPNKNRKAKAASRGSASIARLRLPEQQQMSRFERDGSIHVRELRIPPSDLWSEGFKAFYARRAAESATGPAVPMLARTAPKTEWDKFDAWLDEHINAEPLTRVLSRYPVDVLDTSIAGVRAGIISPRGGIAPQNRGRVLINLHGGGFVCNRGLSFGQLESIPVAALGQIQVVTLDYRQAPFHAYPAASEDVELVYRDLLQRHEPAAIGIFGCSAGGMLAAQAVAWFEAKGLPRPGAVGIFSIAPPPPDVPGPWGSGWGESAIWFPGLPKSEFSATDEAFWESARWYMESADPKDPVAYPGSSEAVLAKFPATLFLSGTRDFAMSVSVVAHARLLKLGVASSLYIMEGGPHGAHVVAVDTPEAHDAQAYIANWFQQHLAQ
jgi:monoterpene epsilon-lactone hydrolase